MNEKAKTPMQLFGNEAPPGWVGLIEPLIEQCKIEDVSIFQIKEKYGALRFYVDGGSPELHDAIDEAERKSRTMCQDCGEPASMRSDNEWLRTLCDVHATAWLKRRESP